MVIVFSQKSVFNYDIVYVLCCLNCQWKDYIDIHIPFVIHYWSISIIPNDLDCFVQEAPNDRLCTSHRGKPTVLSTLSHPIICLECLTWQKIDIKSSTFTLLLPTQCYQAKIIQVLVYTVLNQLSYCFQRGGRRDYIWYHYRHSDFLLIEQYVFSWRDMF